MKLSLGDNEVAVTQQYQLYSNLVIGIDEEIARLTNTLVYHGKVDDTIQYIRGKILGLEWAKKCLKEALRDA